MVLVVSSGLRGRTRWEHERRRRYTSCAASGCTTCKRRLGSVAAERAPRVLGHFNQATIGRCERREPRGGWGSTTAGNSTGTRFGMFVDNAHSLESTSHNHRREAL